MSRVFMTPGMATGGLSVSVNFFGTDKLSLANIEGLVYSKDIR